MYVTQQFFVKVNVVCLPDYKLKGSAIFKSFLKEYDT